jgi:hypothetical protein
MSGIMQSTIGNWNSLSTSPALIYDLDAANFASVPVPSSAQFSGSNWLSFSPGVTIGAGAYTVEGWAYFSTASLPGVMLSTLTAGNGGFTLLIFSATQIRIDRNGVAADTYDIPAMASNTWHHIAATRDASGNQTVFVNGVRSTTGAITNNSNFSGVSAGIGKFNEGGQWWFTGYLTNIRAVVGSNVYDPTQTTITVPTKPLTAVTNTTLLLLFSTTGFLLTDSSSVNNTVTNNSTVAFNAATPFGAVTDATGTYAITVANAGNSITWQSANGGIFSKSNATGTDVIYGGPNYVTGQSYSVFMAYQRTATATGRLLNTQSEASKDWLMGLYNGNPDTFYPNFSVNLPGSGADLIWHFGWATWNTSTSLGQLYTATSAQPTGVAFSATNGGGGGFNQLRMFSRSAGSEVQSGNIGFVKVYNGVLDLATIQAQYTTYAARFGY